MSNAHVQYPVISFTFLSHTYISRPHINNDVCGQTGSCCSDRKNTKHNNSSADITACKSAGKLSANPLRGCFFLLCVCAWGFLLPAA